MLITVARDPLLSLFLALVWAGGIEVLQSFTGLGACEGEDALRYAIGAVAAIAAVHLSGAGRQRPPPRTPRPA